MGEFQKRVNLLKRPAPGIAEVQCSRLRFEPGDRIIVRHFGKLDEGARRRITKSIQKFAGCEVEVLIVDTSVMDLIVEKNPHGI